MTGAISPVNAADRRFRQPEQIRVKGTLRHLTEDRGDRLGRFYDSVKAVPFLLGVSD
jgi:hypothetical protein